MMMTRDQLVTSLAAIERTLNDRIEIWRTVVAPDGHVIKRIYRGDTRRPRAPKSPSRKREQS